VTMLPKGVTFCVAVSHDSAASTAKQLLRSSSPTVVCVLVALPCWGPSA
jgi:hypothetical protein